MGNHTTTKGRAKKPAPVETTTAYGAPGPDAGAETATLTWDDVKKALGAPSADERAMYAIRLGPDERLALGRRITSRKILTDLRRWTGQIVGWLGRTPPATIQAIIGFSVGHVRVALEDGLTLRTMLARFEGRSAELDVEEGGADGALEAQGKATREDYNLLFTAFEHAAKNDAALSRKLATAYSKATKPEPLAAAVDLFCPIARGVLKKKSAIATRLANENVTVAAIDALDQAGKGLAAAAERSNAPRADGPVTERALDLQDGTCIAHMQWLFDFFEALHAKDPSAPHLVPIATRSLFGSHTAAAPAAADEPPADPQKKPS